MPDPTLLFLTRFYVTYSLQQVRIVLEAENARQGLMQLDGRPLLVGCETKQQWLPHLTVAMPEGYLLPGLCLRREQQERVGRGSGCASASR